MFILHLNIFQTFIILEFGRGQMVKEFDKVVFEDEVGVVHGPVQTQVRTSISIFREIFYGLHT